MSPGNSGLFMDDGVQITSPADHGARRTSTRSTFGAPGQEEKTPLVPRTSFRDSTGTLS